MAHRSAVMVLCARKNGEKQKEEVYLKVYDSIVEVRTSLDIYFTFYNTERRHQRLDRRTPDNVYYEATARKVIGTGKALILLPNYWGPLLLGVGQNCWP